MKARAKNVGTTQKNLTAMGDTALAEAPFVGYVELYGYHSLADGWFFAGWVTRRADLADCFKNAVAQFIDETVSGHVTTLFFSRGDLNDEGIGFLIFLHVSGAARNAFRCLQIGSEGVAQNIYPITDARNLPESKLVPRLNFLVSLSDPGLQRREMEVLLHGPSGAPGKGYIEYFGYHPTAGGWLISGWVSCGWADGQAPDRVFISFEEGDVRGETVATLYPRPELQEGAQGAIFFVRAPPGTLGPLCSVSLNVGNVRMVLGPVVDAPQLRETELTARLKSNLAQARPSLSRDRFLNLLARLPYVGEDTLDALSPSIFLYIDEAIQCGSDGLVLMGWMLAKPGYIHEIRVRCGAGVLALQPKDFVKIERPDVLTEFAKHGFDDITCGFITYLPVVVDPYEKLHIEVETQRYEIAYRNIERPTRTGMTAIKQLLGAFDVRFDEMRRAFDRVFGPAVETLNRDRLATRVGYQVVEYGIVPQAPKFSVIVPLYGRLDFVEYQLALFSARPEFAATEFIYVLDDPPKRREAQNLFASIYERFLIPFRAVLLDRNVGFAPANNIGLQHAHGEFIAYLNSDVFPGTQDWLERLSAQVEADSKLGVIGPLLLFEDGSVQHRGMYFERLAEHGDWFFCQHQDKGMRYTGGNDLQYFISITGACMVLRRDLANQVGGFDEIYAIGDFEDSDLCLKLQALGYTCAVDPNVRLYHLERKSQLSGALTWRSNLTAYNAWQHERRWAETIAEKQGVIFGVGHGNA
jgi:GT2 family glycosyltransferase